MNMKPLDWTFDCGVWSASVMGLQLAVVQDADGTYMATCSGGSARPEIQKGFGTPQDARFYAQDTMLRREYQKYFVMPEWTEDDVLDGIAEWFSPCRADACAAQSDGTGRMLVRGSRRAGRSSGRRMPAH